MLVPDIWKSIYLAIRRLVNGTGRRLVDVI